MGRAPRSDPDPSPPPVTVRVADGDGGPDLEVRFVPAVGVTAGDLVEAWPGRRRRGRLSVDGALVDLDAPLDECGLARGALVTVDAIPTGHSPELLVVAGPLPPTRCLATGSVLIGRGAACRMRLDHPSVAPAHALLEPVPGGWRLCPLTSTHATGVDGRPVTGTTALTPGVVVGVGAIDLQILGPARPATIPTPTAPVHRSPRTPVTGPADPGPRPEPADPAPAPSPPGAVSLLLPIAVGAVLAVAVHPTAGLFAVATPVLAVGAHVDARRRWRRDRRREAADHEIALDAHRRARDDHRWQQATQRRRRYPSPADALERAGRGVDLWPIRADDRTPFSLGVGWSDEGTPTPVVATVAEGGHLGIAGARPWAEAVARAVVIQALTRCGPHDRSVAVGTGVGWSFLRWLPHRDGDGPRLTVRPDIDDDPTGVGIEIADRLEQLTDRCQAVLSWSPDGGRLTDIAGDRPAVAVRPLVADKDHAERWARAMARWTDRGSGAPEPPDRVDLTTLLATTGDDAPDDGRRHLRAPLGVGGEGVTMVDLVADGPHALVAGTTGSGKSELLRTWVAALAHRYPPTAVAFVLVDYKGGSAFDACARLPHVTGVVTDLDTGLGERLLVSLRAEVREREEALRAAGLGDLRDLEDGPPRLVVVIDEFATLAAELPDFLGSLVDVARRGRSLGVHLVLATQRPAGAVNDDIRANTALRLCLRTLDAADSHDVLGGPQAASLPARRPGRAWLRSGEHLRLVQVAGSGGDADDPTAAGVAVRRVGAPWPATGHPVTGLERLVTAVVTAWGEQPTPAPVWRPPLPEQLLVEVGRTRRAVTLGQEDRPAERRQPWLGWDPERGHLVVLGGRGRGRTTALRTALLGLAVSRGPDTLHQYVVHRDGALDELTGLPHVGAVVAAQDRATVRRLAHRLEARLAADADGDAASSVLTVIAIDGYEALASSIDDLDGLRLLEALDHLARDGPRHGIVLIVSSSRPSLLPPSLMAASDVVVVLGLDDPADHGLLGLRPPDRPLPVGRGRTLAGHEVQMGRIDLTAVEVAARFHPSGARAGPAPVAPLPRCVPRSRLAPVPGQVAVGLRDRDLTTAAVELRPDGPFVVTGPPRSGRTATLAVLAAQVPDRPATHHRPGDDPTDLRWVVRDWLHRPTPHLFVIDDAELVEDPDGDLRSLVTRRHPDALIVVAVRTDAWRATYGTWLGAIRPAGRGIALSPDPVHDADSWAVPLPTVGPSPPPGRGVLVTDGTAEIIQVAHPDD